MGGPGVRRHGMGIEGQSNSDGRDLMSQRNEANPADGADRPWGEDIVAQLRAMADGELSAAESRALEQRMAAAGESARLEGGANFERGLRSAVKRSMLMSAPGAPDGLLERIQRAMVDAPSHEFDSEAPLKISQGVSGGWGLLAAAALVLTVGVALMMRGGIGALPQTGPGGAQTASIISGEEAARLVSFITRQHDSCAVFGEKFNKKMVARTEAEAAKAAIELLSAVPKVLELGSEKLATAGYEFAGLGRCFVPGDGRSAHLLYKSKVDGAPSVSLFIQEDTGALRLEVDRFYCCEQAEKNGTTLSVWKREGFIYYLFTPDLEHAAGARELFGAPQLRGTMS